MAKYNAIKAAVNAYIKENGRKEITGKILNAVLNATIDSLGRFFQFAGGALPTDDPGTPDQNVCYLAGEPGVYTHFGNITIGNEEVALLLWDGEWKKESVLYGIQEVEASVDNQVGTPSVDVSYTEGRLVLTFHNIKGDRGVTGESAGFGTIGADINGGVGTPGVSVESSGDNTAKNLMFHFTNLKGETGVRSVVATIDDTSGIPSCRVSLVNGVLTLAFSGLKGLKGDTGVSADYPITIYNGLDSDATDQALSAAQGKYLDGKIGLLKTQVDGIDGNFLPGYRAVSSATFLAKNASRAVSPFIPVQAGDTIVWKYMGAANTTSVFFTLYDEDHKYVSYFSASDANQRTFTIGASSLAKYAIATFYYDPDTGLINEGSAVIVNGVEVWSPKYPVNSLLHDSVLYTPQDKDVDEKSVARENLDIPALFTGKKQNYVTGGYVSSEGRYYSHDEWAITDFIPFTSGSVIWRFGIGAHDNAYWPVLAMYDADKAYLNMYSSNSYVDVRELEISLEGVAYIRASFSRRLDGSDNRIPLTLNGIDYQLTDDVRPMDNGDWKQVNLGTLVQANVGSSGNLVYNDSYAPYRVSVKSKVVVPWEGVKLRFFSPLDIPNEMSMVVTCCNSRGQVLESAYFYGPYSEEKTLPIATKSVRISFRKRFRYGASGSNNWSTLSVDAVRAMVSAGTLRVEYLSPGMDVTERNTGIQTQVSAARRVLDVVNNANNGMDKLPVFAHISDLHGDAMRFKNCMDYCDAEGGIDAVLNTGDSTMYDHPDHTSFLPDIANGMNTPMLFCIGNHESFPTGQTSLFEDNIQPLATRQGYLITLDTITDKCYYYKDFASKKIRVIAINYYEDGIYDGHLGQDQIDWFCATLQSTPAGYGVIVMIHSPEDKVVARDGYDKFMQPSPKYGDTYQPNGFYIGNRPIMNIIDAFISKTSISDSFTDNGEVVTISADFSGVDETTEFICYCGGHRHEDNIGYYEHAVNDQLFLGVVCGIALFGDSSNSAWTNQCDLPRGGQGVQQDAFNVFAIDRDGGNVRVVRVGANVTIRFADRDRMIIPYK